MGGSSAPMPYTPAHQGAADDAYYSSLTSNQANNTALYGKANTEYSNLYKNVQNNPYNTQAQQGAQWVAGQANNIGQNEVGLGNVAKSFAPGAMAQGQGNANTALGAIPGAVGTAQGLGSIATGYIPNAMGTSDAVSGAAGSMIPQTAGRSDALYGQIASLLPQLAGMSLKNDQTANSLIPGVLSTGFDPQSNNYNYGMQQATDRAKASAAASGLAGSPFGAGMASDADSAFDRSWTADAQSRQGTAIQQMLSLMGQGSGSDTANILNSLGSTLNATNSGEVGNVNSLLGTITNSNNSGVSNLNSLLGTGLGANSDAVNALTSLLSSANSSTTSGITNFNALNNQYNTDATKGLNTMTEASALPMQTYNYQQGQSTEALNSLVQALNSIGATGAADTGLWGNYMSIGQNSTQIADQATQVNNANSGLGSILGALGSIAGMGTSGGGTLGAAMFGL